MEAGRRQERKTGRGQEGGRKEAGRRQERKTGLRQEGGK